MGKEIELTKAMVGGKPNSVQAYLGCGAGNQFGYGQCLRVDSARLAGFVHKAIGQRYQLRRMQTLA